MAVRTLYSVTKLYWTRSKTSTRASTRQPTATASAMASADDTFGLAVAGVHGGELWLLLSFGAFALLLALVLAVGSDAVVDLRLRQGWTEFSQRWHNVLSVWGYNATTHTHDAGSGGDGGGSRGGGGAGETVLGERRVDGEEFVHSEWVTDSLTGGTSADKQLGYYGEPLSYQTVSIALALIATFIGTLLAFPGTFLVFS